ncbi:MAG TPA: hypothetical protein VIT21_12785 [Chthoniobacterales bacterium]
MATQTQPAIRPDFIEESWISKTVNRFLRPLFESARKSSSLIVSDGLRFEVDGCPFHVPKFMFLGERGGGVPIRVGIFTGFDTLGLNLSIALAKLVGSFEARPQASKDYALFFYPVVNPRSAGPVEFAPDLDRAFWKNSTLPEVWFLESELRKLYFQSLISLRVTPWDEGFAAVRSKFLGEEVVAPSLQQISHLVNLRSEPVVLRNGESVSGRFGPLEGTKPTPFELELNIPLTTPLDRQIEAIDIFIREILHNYRRVISHAQDI